MTISKTGKAASLFHEARDVAYWPSEKWLAPNVMFDPFAKQKTSVPLIQYEPFPHRTYVFQDARIATLGDSTKHVAFIKIWRRMAQRAAEVRNLITSIEQSIEASRKILDIEENWDGEGSPAYDESTWKHAAEFVRRTAIPFVTRYQKKIQPPRITPGPDGSVDVRWIAAKRTMLLNFQAGENVLADFFGHDQGQDIIKGTLDLTSENQWLLLWLTR